MSKRFKTTLPMGHAALPALPMEESTALRLLLEDEERPKRLRENDFGGDTDDPVAIEEGFTKTEAEISAAANRILHRSSSSSDLLYERRFRAHFGVSPQVAARTWELLQSRGDPQPDEATIDRFLWGLLLLMCYDVEPVNCTHAAGVDEQTFRKWSWHFIDAISFLEADVVGFFCFLSSSDSSKSYI